MQKNCGKISKIFFVKAESMNRIDSYTKDMEYDSFNQNQLVIDAVIRNLEIIGEAARNIPEEIDKAVA